MGMPQQTQTSALNHRYWLRASHVGLAFSLAACAGSRAEGPPPAEAAPLPQTSSAAPLPEAPRSSSPPTTAGEGASSGAQSSAPPEPQPTLAAASSFPTPPEPNTLTRSPIAVL